MSADRVVLTAAGAARLQAELSELKSTGRRKISQALAEARAHGDLSENAEYHAAKEQQGVMEARIRELDHALSIAEVINPASISASGQIVFSCEVVLYDETEDTELTYRIVGHLEADLTQGLLSVHSPLGRALIGKSEGDVVQVEAPAGLLQYEVITVRYG